MNIEEYIQRILIPAEGMWLCNDKEKVFSKKVYLGKDADENDWREIDEAEKERLEKEWYPDEAVTPDAD